MIFASDGDERSRRLRGIALMFAAGLLFSTLDTSAKYLVASYAAVQVVFIRFVGHLLLTVVFAAPSGHASLWRTERPWLMIARAGCIVGASILNVTAFRYLQLAEATSIFYSVPLVIAVLAGPLLGEWIGPRRWAAVIIGFAGVLVITRPGLGDVHPAAFLSMLAAVLYALYAVTTRMLAASEGNASQQFYVSLLGCAVLAPLMPAVWIWPQSTTDLVIMALMGVLGFAGHGMLISAHRYAPAPILGPFVYIQIVWAMALGFLVFGDIPGIWTLVGASIVVGSGLYLLVRERQVAARGPDAPPQ